LSTKGTSANGTWASCVIGGDLSGVRETAYRNEGASCQMITEGGRDRGACNSQTASGYAVPALLCGLCPCSLYMFAPLSVPMNHTSSWDQGVSELVTACHDPLDHGWWK
jgi:hypothetical protein